MNLSHQSTAVMVITLVLYIVVAIWLLARQWPLRAGLAMVVVALLPLVWQAIFTDSGALGFGLLAALLLVPAFLLIAAGLLVAGARLVSRRWRPKGTGGTAA